MYRDNPYKFNAMPDVVKNLLIINGLMYLATIALYGMEIDLTRILGLFYIESDYFRPYQFVTHMFMHGSLLHIFANMFALWMFGTRLENFWGPKRFLFFYFFCGFGAAIIHSTVTYLEIQHLEKTVTDMGYLMQVRNIPTVGASGAVFGVLLAFGMIFPNTQLMLLFPPIPIKAKYFVFFYAIFELYAGISSIHGGSNIAHFAHLGGMLFGYILIKYWSRQRRNFY
jgi:membrane associated rhomboid family serine protease